MIETDRLIAPARENPQEEAIERALRPKRLAEYVGQAKIREQLSIFIEAAKRRKDTLDHVLLFGSPGLGKTTLARMMATQFSCEFIALSAVFSGIKEVREAVAQAEMWRAQGRRTILFVDEIHRFNKAMKKIQFSKFLH